MNAIKTLLLLLSFTTALFAQGPDTLWTRGVALDGRMGRAVVIETADLGYAVFLNEPATLMRLNSQGDTLWSRRYQIECFGGSGLSPVAIFERADHGFMIFGTACTNGLPESGIMWLRVGSTGDSLDSRIYLMSRHYRSSWASTAKRLSNGHYVISGNASDQSSSPFVYPAVLIEVDSEGDSVWSATFAQDSVRWWDDVEVLNDGSIVVIGHSIELKMLQLIKYDFARNIVWSRQIFPTWYGNTINIERDGDGFLLLTSEAMPDTTHNAVGIRCDSEGYVLSEWFRAEALCNLYSVSSGGYIATYYSRVSRINAWGDIFWEQDHFGWQCEGISALAELSDHGYVMISTIYEAMGMSHLEIIRTLPDTTTITAISDERAPLPSEISLVAYPNPFNAQTTFSFSLERAGEVELNVYNLSGREVRQAVDDVLRAGQHEVLFDGSTLAAGVYFARLVTGDGVALRKVLLLK